MPATIGERRRRVLRVKRQVRAVDDFLRCVQAWHRGDTGVDYCDIDTCPRSAGLPRLLRADDLLHRREVGKRRGRGVSVWHARDTGRRRQRKRADDGAAVNASRRTVPGDAT